MSRPRHGGSDAFTTRRSSYADHGVEQDGPPTPPHVLALVSARFYSGLCKDADMQPEDIIAERREAARNERG